MLSQWNVSRFLALAVRVWEVSGEVRERVQGVAPKTRLQAYSDANFPSYFECLKPFRIEITYLSVVLIICAPR